MERNAARIFVVLLAVLALSCSRVWAVAAAPSFRISATNATMSPSGSVEAPVLVTSVNGYAGTVMINCIAPNEPATVHAPYCDIPGPVAAIVTLTANATVSSQILFYSQPVPAVVQQNMAGLPSQALWALAGIPLLWGWSLRKQRARLRTGLLMAGMFLVLMGMGACGGGSGFTTSNNLPQFSLTPGSYTFTLEGVDEHNSSLTADATVVVTVQA